MLNKWCVCLAAAASLLTLTVRSQAQGPTNNDNNDLTANAAAGIDQENPSSPLSFKIGDFDFTPGGFLDFTTVWRSTDVGSGIGTNFASIPLDTSVTGRVSEFRESAQNSRLSLRMDGAHGNLKLTGYVEMDFLGNQPTNIAVTSNAATLRMRIYIADVRDGDFELVAGQDWSLLTANRSGLSPFPSDIFYSQAMDTNYLAGLVWARQPQIRLIWHASPNWTWAVSAENPEQYVGGSSGANTVTLPTTPNVSSEVDSGASSYSDPGFAPDVITKLAFDSKPGGHGLHAEIGGVESTFRIFDPTTGTTARKVGGGGVADLNAELAPGIHFILNTFLSDGAGRYLFGIAPDLMVRNNGEPSPIHSASSVVGIEAQVDPAWLIYTYYSGLYIGKDVDLSGASPIGYGFNSTFNRAIQEPTLGVTHTFFKNPNYGALQLITQGSYITRDLWTTANPRGAHLFEAYADLRYVLP